MTVTVQDAPEAIVAPLSFTAVSPPTSAEPKVLVRAPPPPERHVPPTFGAAATTRPDGKVSVKVAFVTAAPVLLVTVIVSLELAPVTIDVGLNDLASDAPEPIVICGAFTAEGLHTAGEPELQTAVPELNVLVNLAPEGVF